MPMSTANRIEVFGLTTVFLAAILVPVETALLQDNPKSVMNCLDAVTKVESLYDSHPEVIKLIRDPDLTVKCGLPSIESGLKQKPTAGAASPKASASTKTTGTVTPSAVASCTPIPSKATPAPGC
jgi:hypothetical protein